jgi:glucose-6-phosphate isomerase
MTISISGKRLADESSPLFATLRAAAVKLAAKDSTLWGSAAQSEASVRLNWIGLPESSQELLPALAELVSWAESNQLTQIILAGMGGSSLAPEVISKAFKKELTVLDTTDPDQIRKAIPADPAKLAHSVVVVGSKSGSTIETASHKALFEELFTQAGLLPRDHIVIVTDPGSPLDQSSRSAGLRTINADPNVGGRYSALSAFGLVPAALMGVDVAGLLADARVAAARFTSDDSPAVNLAAAIYQAGEQNVAFSDKGSSTPGLSDWIEQLIAESTGKNERGRLPIAIESIDAPVAGSHYLVNLAAGSANSADAIVTGSLGEQFILWEWVTALLGVALEVDPFNQPNVTEAKERTSAILAKWSSSENAKLTPAFEDENFAIYSASSAQSLRGQLDDFLAIDSHYIAIMAYLARGIDDEITRARGLLARKSGRGTTFGWGPRFLHSTGQFHKGGQHNGAFIQVTGENLNDLAIPGRDFSFHTLLMAQALGDGEALADRHFPLIRIHLKNRSAGIAELLAALK